MIQIVSYRVQHKKGRDKLPGKIYLDEAVFKKFKAEDREWWEHERKVQQRISTITLVALILTILAEVAGATLNLLQKLQ